MRSWVLRDYDHDVASSLELEFGLDRIQAILLSQRVKSDHKKWLDSFICDVAPNVARLPDIKKFISYIKKARKIGIFSDYDVDGVTSAVIWQEFLSSVQKEVVTYIPPRECGYGINPQGTNWLEEQGVDCLLFLDCGTDQYDKIHSTNLPRLVIDHHVVKGQNDYEAFINPYRPDCDCDEFTSLCTAALSLLVIVAVARTLESKFDYSQLFDLAAIGTVADVMPLTGFNRAVTKAGLARINLEPRVAVQSLLTGRGVYNKVTAQDIAFGVAPKLNAAGRIAHARLALELFTPNLVQREIEEKVVAIEALNFKRKEIEFRVLAEAEELIGQFLMSEKDLQKASCIVSEVPSKDIPDEVVSCKMHDSQNSLCLALQNVIALISEDWHLGVLGIVASKLKERYHKPVFLLAKCGGMLKGSARSDTMNLGQWIQYAISEGAIKEGGGHKAAAGMSLVPENIGLFRELLAQIPYAEPTPLIIDIEVTIAALLNSNADMLEPFGSANPCPRFLLRNLSVCSCKMLKDIHAKVTFTDGVNRLVAMYFYANKTYLVVGKKLDVVIKYSSGEYIVYEVRDALTARNIE